MISPPRPKQVTSTMNVKPHTTPQICGTVQRKPKLAAEAASIRLLGPGVRLTMAENMIIPMNELLSIMR